VLLLLLLLLLLPAAAVDFNFRILKLTVGYPPFSEGQRSRDLQVGAMFRCAARCSVQRLSQRQPAAAAGAALVRRFSSVEEEGTPPITRLSLHSSSYGAESEEPSDAIESLKRLAKKPAKGKPSKVHSRQALYDDELLQADDDKLLSDVAREVKTATPDLSRLSFNDSDYGDDIMSPEAAARLHKVKEMQRAKGGKASRVHSRQSLYDDELLQADDEKLLSDVAREVKTATPDLSRLSFNDSDYGTDVMPDAAAGRVKGVKQTQRAKSGKVSGVHSRQALYDDELLQADDEKLLSDIAREVKTATPDLSRLSFNDSDYGTDVMPDAAAGRVKGVKQTQRAKSSKVSGVHSRQALYDDELLQSDDDKLLSDIAREVKTATPDLSRLSFNDSDYGTDVMPDTAAGRVRGVKQTQHAKSGKVSGVHSRQALYDDDLLQADDEKLLSDVAREVKTATPDLSRLSFNDSDYGTDVMPDTAADRVKGVKQTQRAKSSKVSGVHSRRAMYDSELSMQSGDGVSFDDVQKVSSLAIFST
jgi:chromosome condensin MukBEF MukE localization factor